MKNIAAVCQNGVARGPEIKKILEEIFGIQVNVTVLALFDKKLNKTFLEKLVQLYSKVFTNIKEATGEALNQNEMVIVAGQEYMFKKVKGRLYSWRKNKKKVDEKPVFYLSIPDLYLPGKKLREIAHQKLQEQNIINVIKNSLI